MLCGDSAPSSGAGAQPPEKYGRLYLKIARADKLKYTTNFISAYLLWISSNIVLYISQYWLLYKDVDLFNKSPISQKSQMYCVNRSYGG